MGICGLNNKLIIRAIANIIIKINCMLLSILLTVCYKYTGALIVMVSMTC
jgi:hypothetical protein